MRGCGAARDNWSLQLRLLHDDIRAAEQPDDSFAEALVCLLLAKSVFEVDEARRTRYRASLSSIRTMIMSPWRNMRSRSPSSETLSTFALALPMPPLLAKRFQRCSSAGESGKVGIEARGLGAAAGARGKAFTLACCCAIKRNVEDARAGGRSGGRGTAPTRRGDEVGRASARAASRRWRREARCYALCPVEVARGLWWCLADCRDGAQEAENGEVGMRRGTDSSECVPVVGSWV